MTAWLSDWLRDIVLIILLATFVDLLIPNNSLQRYVKVVVSLIILLTILSPVISFLKEDITINRALEQVSGKKDESESLNLILSNGAKLKSEQERSSARLTEQQIGVMTKEAIEKSLSIQVREVAVTIAAEEDGVSPTIQLIHIVVRTKSEIEEQTYTTNEVSKVDSISPVTVKVILDNKETQASTTNENQSERSATELKLENQLIEQIMEQWGLKKNSIQVEWG